MGFVRSLRQLLRHRYFRRLLAVRVATQSCDGVLQVALAAYVLFSPQRQPDAGSVAAVLAITLLPFSVLGPFVGVVLDRWSRRQILVVADLCRAGLAVGLAGLVASGLRTPAVETAFYAGVLLTMSLNRFLLAALSAALPHTVDPGEYMVANSVMPTVGPAGLIVGVAAGTGLRVLLAQRLLPHQADAALFGVVAAGFVLSAGLALRIPRRQLGPDHPQPARIREITAGLAEALAHLRARPAAGLGLVTIGAQRIAYGVLTVASILLYRNHFHRPEEVDAALVDLGLLAGVTGAGFVLAAVLTPPLSARIGIRACMVSALVGCAVFQVLPGALFREGPLLAASFLLGVTAQSLKLCVDTLVQAHVDDDLKGRVFVLYDMVFNVALVAAAGLAAVLLPPDGRSLPVFLGLAGCYLAIAAGFTLLGRGLSMDEGTESLRTSAARRSGPTRAVS